MLTKGVKSWWPIGLIMFFALGLRILFAPGVGFEGSFQVMHNASQIASALRPFSVSHLFSTLPLVRAELGLRSIAADFPLGVIYAVFGESDLVTRAFGLACSLFAVLMVYLIARRLLGEKSAALAALVLALIPQDIFYSGTLTQFTFWLPIALFAAYLGLSFRKLRIDLIAPLVLISPLLIIVGEFWLAIFLILWWLCVWAEHALPGRGLLLAGLAVLVGFVVCVIVYWQDLPIWRASLLEPGSYLLIALFGVSLVAALKSPALRRNAVFLWLLLAAAVFLGGLAAGSPPAALVIVFIIGFCILSGNYLSALLAQSLPATLAIVMAVTIIFAYFGIQAQQELVPSFEGLDWLGFHSLFLFSNIAGGIFISLIVASAAFPIRKKKVASGIGLVLLVLFPFAMLYSIWGKIFPYRMLTESIRSSSQALTRIENSLRVHVVDELDREFLTYYKTQLGGRFPIVRNWITPSTAGDGYVLTREGELQDVPRHWLKVENFGWLRDPTRLVLYRSMIPASATIELQKAHTNIEESTSFGNYYSLYQALINAGDFCQAYQAWIKAMQLGDGSSDSIPILTDQGCFQSAEEGELNPGITDLLVYNGYIETDPTGQYENGALVWQVRRRYAFYDDPRIFDLRSSLLPDSFYLYSADLRGRGSDPFYTLYWRIGDTEGYLDKKAYPEWERVSLLIYSGQAEDGDIELRYSPILIDNFGIVFFSKVDLFRVSP